MVKSLMDYAIQNNINFGINEKDIENIIKTTKLECIKNILEIESEVLKNIIQ